MSIIKKRNVYIYLCIIYPKLLFKSEVVSSDNTSETWNVANCNKSLFRRRLKCAKTRVIVGKVKERGIDPERKVFDITMREVQARILAERYPRW